MNPGPVAFLLLSLVQASFNSSSVKLGNLSRLTHVKFAEFFFTLRIIPPQLLGIQDWYILFSGSSVRSSRNAYFTELCYTLFHQYTVSGSKCLSFLGLLSRILSAAGIIHSFVSFISSVALRSFSWSCLIHPFLLRQPRLLRSVHVKLLLSDTSKTM